MNRKKYQPYHTLMKNSDTIKVSGCWSHARRKFAEIVKAAAKGATLTPAQTIAAEAVKRIDAMYHLDNKYKDSDSSAEERLDNRQQSVLPLVDAYFAWLKVQQTKSNSSTKLKEAVNYSVNQEQYLRCFLQDPHLPLDNNDAERSIKAFCGGKHSWHIIVKRLVEESVDCEFHMFEKGPHGMSLANKQSGGRSGLMDDYVTVWKDLAAKFLERHGLL